MKKTKKFQNIRNKTVNNKTLLAILGAVLVVLAGIFAKSLLTSEGGRGLLRMPISKTGNLIAGIPNEQVEDLPAHYTKNVIINLPILMYHHVGTVPDPKDALRKDLTVSPENFELQVAWLKGQGYHSVSLHDLQLFFQNKTTLPDKPIIFTFDDGYGDVFENAFPILQKYGYHGSAAIITQFVGMDLGTNSYASWNQIKNAAKEGHEIVSHTQDHFDGTNRKYDQNFILRNLADSKKDLKDKAGVQTSVLIYPYGHFNDAYIKLAKKTGYEMGITVNYGRQIGLKNLMEIPRLRVHGQDDLEKFKKLILE